MAHKCYWVDLVTRGHYIQWTRGPGIRGPGTWGPGTQGPKKTSKIIFSQQYLALLCSYLPGNPLIAKLCLALGLRPCVLLEVLGVKGHVHILISSMDAVRYTFNTCSKGVSSDV